MDNEEKESEESEFDLGLDNSFTAFLKGLILNFWTERKLYLLIGSSLFFFSLTIVVALAIIPLDSVYFNNYAIVINAGTQGTVSYMYKWVQKAKVSSIAIKKIDECSTDNVLTLYESKTVEKLLACLAILRAKMRIWYINYPTVYLLATGSMRQLQYYQYPLFLKVIDYIQIACIDEKWTFKTFGVLLEENEAFYTWMGINYFKIFGQNKSTDESKTVGILNMKYDDLQIVYETPHNAKTVVIDQQMRKMHIRNYYCFGLDLFYNTLIYLKSLDSFADTFRCNNAGMRDTKFVEKWCPFASVFSVSRSNFQPNSIMCQEDLTLYLMGAFAPLHLTNTKFLALNLFADYYLFLKTFYNVSHSLQSFADKTEQHCSESYDNLVKRFKSPDICKKYCFLGQYMIKIFQLLGFNESTYQNIEFTTAVSDLTIEWTYQFMTDKTEDIPIFLFYVLNTIISSVLISIFSFVIFMLLGFFLFILWDQYKTFMVLNDPKTYDAANADFDDSE